MRHLSARTHILSAAVVLLVGASVSAHHSGAMYEPTKTVTLTGKVKQFRWVNPHVILIITTDGTAAEPATDWAIEMSSPSNMSRYSGWNRTSVAFGEAVEVVAAPLRDGGHGAACRSVKRLDTGTTLPCGAIPAIQSGETANLP